MGVHYVNGDLVGDGELDPAKPETLMYEMRGLDLFYALHVWAWRDNPHGTFVNFSPNVSCDGFAPAS